MPQSIYRSTDPESTESWKKKAYALARRFDYVAILDSGCFTGKNSWGDADFMAGFGLRRSCAGGPGFFRRWEIFSQETKHPLMGYLSYDLKNHIESLSSSNQNGIGAEEAFFFEPEHFLEIKDGEVRMSSFSSPVEFERLLDTCTEAVPEDFVFKGEIRSRMERSEYLEKVESIRRHIQQGDVYEMNLCVEFYSENAVFHPYLAMEMLRKTSPAPFGAFLKISGLYICSASPERFLRKSGSGLLSQPIKGTRKRGKTLQEDELLKKELAASEKDKAENVMIVDLVRNDLARSCVPGSVRVEELFGIYSFPQVHQMISSVSGILEEGNTGISALKAAFPMGSMTGAPKVRSMQLIEEHENSGRGIYSGAIGYVLPNGDFDFNVVIRTLLYNEKDSYLSYQAGGAITYDSKAEEEWDEIMVKASGIFEVLKK